MREPWRRHLPFWRQNPGGEVGASVWVDNVALDLRYAARSLRRQPAFAAAVIVTLGLAVGANLTFFSLVDALFFRPPAGVADPASLRRLYDVKPNMAGIVRRPVGSHFSYPEFRSIREATRGVARVAVDYPIDSADVVVGASTTVAGISYATADLLPMLGVRIERGRAFSESEDDVSSAEAVAVVSHEFSKRVFGESGDPLGASIRVRDRVYRVIGVAATPYVGLDLGATSIWVPFSLWARIDPDDPRPWYTKGDSYIPIVARLLPGADANGFEARATLGYRRVHDANARAYVNARIIAASILRARGPDDRSREELIAPRIAAVAVLLFVIACANVANLLLARSWTRRREFAVRAALGISHARLAMLVFLEALLLAGLAGVCSLIVGHWGGSVLRTQILPRVRWSDAVLAPRMMVFAAAIAFVAALLAGAAPALIVSSARNTDALKSGADRASTRRSRVRATLIVVQTALAVVLVVGAFLFDESLRNVRGVDLGYDAKRLVVGSVYFPDRQRHPESGRLLAEVAARIGRTPGIAGAVVTYGGPLDSWIQTPLYRASADSSHPIPNPPYFAGVGSDYFRITGTRIVEGRGFLPSDRAGSEPVMIVGSRMAQQLWPGERALGQCLRPSKPSSPCYRVVGIAEDAHELHIVARPETQYYYPLEQLPMKGAVPRAIFVRAGMLSPDDVATTLRGMLRETFPGAVLLAESMTRQLEPEMRPWILGARVFATLSALALLVAMIGVYAMASFEARQRTREIGVRIALGARGRDVVTLLVRQETVVVAIGVVCGGAVAIAAGRFVSSILFGVSPRDPLTILGAAGVLLAVAITASFLPSWRATRVDPVVVLREE